MKRIQQALTPFYVAYVKDVNDNLWALALSSMPCPDKTMGLEIYNLEHTTHIYRFSRREVRRLNAALVDVNSKLWFGLEFNNKVEFDRRSLKIKAVTYTLVDASL